MSTHDKPVIGISCGDINGIGIELIIRTLSDNRILDHCIPLVFVSNKVINFYKKSLPEYAINYQSVKEFNKLNNRQVNLFTCWEEDINITPGQLTDVGGKYAVISLRAAVDALKEKQIDGLVTAPIHKSNIQSADFNYPGHTNFLRDQFQVKDVVMMLCSGDFRVGLVTEHVPIHEVAKFITKEAIVSKLTIMHQSLQRDFGIDAPRIAVLGLNPHAGDEGLIGKEEETIIKPALKEARNNNILAFGPYSADAFFARRQFEKFDAVLAMYHDQGLIPFKSLATDGGYNFTAGLPAVRTSPDHGVAFDIAGKAKADDASFMTSIFECIDIIKRRSRYQENRKNPIRKINPEFFGRMEDEAISS